MVYLAVKQYLYRIQYGIVKKQSLPLSTRRI